MKHLKFTTIPARDLRVGHIVKKRRIPMPDEALEKYGHLNDYADKLFEITKSKLQYSADFDTTYHTGCVVGEELDDALNKIKNGKVQEFESGDFPFSLLKIIIQEKGVPRTSKSPNILTKGELIHALGCEPYTIIKKD